MTDKAHAELLDDVLSRHEGSPNARLREITEAAIRHLHAFVEEVNLQRDEWFAGIQFLTAIGQKCDDRRQEFILLSDTLGVSTLVEMVTYHGVDGSTENTVLGPFYVPNSPPRAKGETMLVDPDEGDRVVIRGTVTDVDGNPLAGATLDCWQNATHGFYAVQQPDVQTAENLRGIYTTDDDGTYEIRTVRPVPYPIPSDGPVGDMLKAHRRDWMRPGHTHMLVRADGYKDLITHLFDEQTDHLRDDAVFGVRDSLIRAFEPDAERRAGHHLRHRVGSRSERSYSATTGLVRVPIPVMVTSTVSPGCKQDRWRPGVADAARRAGGDHVARLERGPDRRVGDQLGDRVDHVLDRRVLELLTVHRRAQLGGGRVDLVGRHDPRAERARAVEVLARGELRGVALVVAEGAVLEARVPTHVVEGVGDVDGPARPADHHGQLALVVEGVAGRRAHERRARRHERGRGTG